MQDFWNGFEKRAAFGAAVGGLMNRVAQSGVGQAVAGGVKRLGQTMVGGLPIASHASNAVNTLGRVTGVQHMRQGVRQVGKLMNNGAINHAGELVNPAMQGAAAAAQENLRTGARRLGGTALAAGGAMYAGKKMFGSQPQQQQPAQPAQQPPAAVPTYR